MINRAEGLVIGPDGTVYFSDFGNHVMRWAPPYTTPPELTWVTIPGTRILGVMLDPKKKVLYAGARSAPVPVVPDGGVPPDAGAPPATPGLYKIDVATATATRVVDIEAGANGLTMGDDGSVYYADQCCNPGMADPNRGHIYRVTAAGVKSQVTTTSIDNADGIAFGPDKKLYVIPYLETGVPITRLTLDATGKETARDVFVDLATADATLAKHGDGIAFDSQGNVYLTANALWKVKPDKTITKLDAQGGANIEFGVGALPCTQLIWVTNSGTIHPKQLPNDIPGADVYWHRP